jgi:hypothetical protein
MRMPLRSTQVALTNLVDAPESKRTVASAVVMLFDADGSQDVHAALNLKAMHVGAGSESISSGGVTCKACKDAGVGAGARWYTRAACLSLLSARDTGDVSIGAPVLNLHSSCMETAAVLARYASVSGSMMHADVEVGALCQHATMCATHSSAISTGGCNQT